MSESSDKNDGPLTLAEVIDTARALFQHYGWNNPGDTIMRNRIERMRDMALTTLSSDRLSIPAALDVTNGSAVRFDDDGFVAISTKVWDQMQQERLEAAQSFLSPASAVAPREGHCLLDVPQGTPCALAGHCTESATQTQYPDENYWKTECEAARRELADEKRRVARAGELLADALCAQSALTPRESWKLMQISAHEAKFLDRWGEWLRTPDRSGA